MGSARKTGLMSALTAYPSDVKTASKLKFSAKKNSTDARIEHTGRSAFVNKVAPFKRLDLKKRSMMEDRNNTEPAEMRLRNVQRHSIDLLDMTEIKEPAPASRGGRESSYGSFKSAQEEVPGVKGTNVYKGRYM